jgi:sialate O-acetylesterase
MWLIIQVIGQILNKLKMKRTVLIILLFVGVFYSNAQLKVAGIFGNNAVIQQEIAAPVWGQAKAGEAVTVQIAGNEVKTSADKNGDWMVRLIPMKADGKQYELTVKSGTETIVFKNIKIGEVWFASGQSNMQFKMGGGLKNQDEEIANANYSDIRFNTVDLNTSVQPQKDIQQKDWQICNPTNVKDFSAVAYFFARELNLDKKVPVGIIVGARGATNLETWMSRERLMTHPDFHEQLAKLGTDTAVWNNKVRKAIQSEKDRDLIANTSMSGLNLKVNALKYNDADWTKTCFPINMGKMGYPGFWGLVWIRKTIEIPTKSAKKEWKIQLPIKDQDDRIYLNGKEIARSVSKLKEKVITFPVGSLKVGTNLLAVRMYVQWGSAEIGNDKNDCYLFSNDGERIELNGEWKSSNKIEPAVAQWQDYYNSSTVNFNAVVNPVIPYGIKGFLWYQGENNASRFKQYADLQPMLIDDWRVRWRQGYLPFLYVQLANYMERSATPKSADTWASFRDAQTSTLSKSQNTGMVCTIDIGDGNDIHPKNKQEVGKRLYIIAKAKAYGSTEVYSGPMFKSAKLEGSCLKITFDFAQNGLKTADNQALKGFAICDKEGKWNWANAKISGTEISIENATNVTRIQYAWQSNPDCNLQNAEGLPAVPFNVEIDPKLLKGL